MADLDSPDFAWPAPAKINRFLHICGREPNGYHRLQTVFQFIDWCDELFFQCRDDGKIVREYQLSGVAEEDDIVIKAARLLIQTVGDVPGVSINLKKTLPMGGGLGGGSSNAATVLVALNYLWKCNLDVDRLAALGLSLGADVPVFVRGQSAWAEGVGERLSKIDLDEPWYLVVVPDCSVSTKEIFTAPELFRDHPEIDEQAFRRGEAGNDCEPVVRARYPQVAAVLDWLSDYGAPRMSGTGASVFAAFEQREHAEDVAAQCPPGSLCRVVKGMNASPLRALFYAS